MERLSAAAIEVLAQAGTLVTETAQQAFQIRLAWAVRQRREGHTQWATPDVLPLSGWLTRTWNRAFAEDASGQLPSLLTRLQEQSLWDSIVAESAAAAAYLQPFGASTVARRAWRRLHDWSIDPAAVARGVTEEAELFAAWGRTFVRRAAQQGAIEPARAQWQLPQSLALRGRPWRAIGFDDETPALLKVSRSLDVVHPRISGPAIASRSGRIGASDPDNELEWIAAWARARLLANPEARLLVIVPDLEQRRARVERALDEALSPETLLFGAPRSALYAIEAGRPLDAYPLVQTALTTLDLLSARISFTELSGWLRSPYLLGSATWSGERARVDLALRGLLSSEVSIGQLLRNWETCRSRTNGVDPLLHALRSQPEGDRNRRTLSAWSSLFAKTLQAVGWAAEGLDSVEHQTLEKFKEALAALATLDDLMGTVMHAQALNHLRRVLGQTPFQAETGDVAVTLTSRRGDPALAYDGIWLAGAHEGEWPPAPRPDPLIPWELQRAAGIPEATPEGTRTRAERIHARLLESAPEVVCSWPQRREDDEWLPSPLLARLPDLDAHALGIDSRPSFWRRVQLSARIERLTDDRGPSLVEAGCAPGTKLAGGVKTLQLQSQCAFRAFAERRLLARRLEEPPIGIDPMSRGKLVHRALDLLWRDLGTQQALRELSADARRALVRRVADDAATEVLSRDPRWGAELVELEHGRLVTVLEESLAIEMLRPPFRVAGRELRHTTSLAGFALEMRIDRIDELPDGRRLVIDYKTGTAPLTGRVWEGDRPDDPQLPIYAVTLEPRPDAIAIERVAVGECTFKALSSAPPVVAKADVERDWPLRVAQWRRIVDRLASEFVTGVAPVNPKQPPKTCELCHLHAFCRIDERRASLDGGDADEV